jgi:hypothetical protein
MRRQAIFTGHWQVYNSTDPSWKIFVEAILGKERY